MTGLITGYKTSLKVSYIMVCMVMQILASDDNLPGEICHTGAENKYRQSLVFVDGVKRCCDSCQKGDYMKEVCDIDKPHTTTCFECHYGTYTDLPNLRESCMPHVRCDYTKHMVVKIPGSRIRDYVCECEPGYYELNSGLCKPWTKCPKGSGVVKPGDSQHDLECRVCPNGTFANEFDRIAECLPHRNCESEGLVTVKNGTNSEDAVCEAPSTTTVSAGIYSLTLVPSYQDRRIYLGVIVSVILFCLVICGFVIGRCICQRYRSSQGNRPACVPAIEGDGMSDTDTLPPGAEAANFQSLENGTGPSGARRFSAGTSVTNNTSDNTMVKFPVGTSDSDYRGHRHPRSQPSTVESESTSTPNNIKTKHEPQTLGDRSVFGISESGSHISTTTQNVYGRILRCGDDGMPTSSVSDIPTKDRQVHRQAEQDSKQKEDHNGGLDHRIVDSEDEPLL